MKKITFLVDENEVEVNSELLTQIREFGAYLSHANLGPSLAVVSGHAELEDLGTVANYSSYVVSRFWVPCDTHLALHVVTADGYVLNVSEWLDSVIALLPKG